MHFPLCVIGKDRKSTRLNSSHVAISYAVFCLKKKNNVDSEAPIVSHHPFDPSILPILTRLPPRSTLFPYTTLFRSVGGLDVQSGRSKTRCPGSAFLKRRSDRAVHCQS